MFGRERAKKGPKGALFMAAASPRKHLKIYNFGTKNAIVMKLTTIIFMRPSIWQKIGTELIRVYEGVNEKLENESSALIFTNFLTTSKTVTYVMHYFALHQW